MQEQRINLLSTRLRIPPLHSDMVPRPRLLHRLNKGATRKLTFITAPAGFGKTTLLSEWATQDHTVVAWISLHHDDNDAAHFFHYLLAALENVSPGLGDQVSSLLSMPYFPFSKSVLTTLINILTSVPDNFVLVLDDYHFIHEQQIHEGMYFLLQHLPDHMHIMIASRAKSPFPLTHLRGQGQLIEISAVDLRFTHPEVVRLHQIMNLQLSHDDMAQLEKHIEGWVTGFHLAALSLQRHSDISAFLKTFSGNNRFILEYLSEEVLSHLPEYIQTFLLQTSFLDHLTASLCDMVTGRCDSQSILKLLEQQGLFIVALDDNGCWYRYHHLFIEVLQHHLRQTSPSLLPELHRRASQWYEQNAMITAAIEHALIAQCFPRVIRLVEQIATTIWMRGDLPILLKWLQTIPDELVHSRPRLCLFYAWILYVFNQANAALSYLHIAEHTLDASADSTMYATATNGYASQNEDISTLAYVEDPYMLAIVQASSAIMQGDVTRTIEQAPTVLKNLSEDAPLWRGLVTLGLGFAYQSKGDIVLASQAIKEACKISQHAGNSYTRLFALSTLAQLQIEQGQFFKARRTYQQVIDADTTNSQFSTIIGWAYVGISEVFREWNNLNEALYFAQKGINCGEQGGNDGIVANGYTALAHIKLAQEDFDGALDCVQKAEQIARTCMIPLIASHAVATQAHIWIVRGNTEVADHWTREAKLHVNAELCYAHEVEYIIFARLLLVEGRYDTAITLLHRLLTAAEMGGRTKKVVEILLLQALAYTHSQNEIAKALDILSRVLLLAQPEGYIRIFVDEGSSMAALLAAFYTSQSQHHFIGLPYAVQAYVKELMTLLNVDHPVPTPSIAVAGKQIRSLEALVEPFSEREMEVLRLITLGLSNREIAQEMIITTGTVKWYLSNIYSKLNVHSRTQAIAKVRDLGLLP